VDVDKCSSDVGKQSDKAGNHVRNKSFSSLEGKLIASIGVNDIDSQTSRTVNVDNEVDDNKLLQQEVLNNFQELIKDVPYSGWCLSRLNEVYKERFGMFIPRPLGETLSQVVMRADDSGVLRWEKVSRRVVHPDFEVTVQKNLIELMKDVPDDGVRLCRFNELYKANFGIFIPRRQGASLSEVVKQAADAGVCQIKLRYTEIWVHRCERGKCCSKMTLDASRQPCSDSAKTCEGASFHENMRELMKDVPCTGVEIGHFNKLFKERFGMFIPRQAPANLSDIIKEAQKAGVLALETRNGRSSWVVPLSKSNSSSKETFFGEKQDPGVSSDASWGGKMQDTGGNKMSRGIRKTMVLGDLLKPLSPEENI
jgi:hypothetical protein